MSRDHDLSRLSSKLQRLAHTDQALNAIASAVAKSLDSGKPLDVHFLLAGGPSVTKSVLLDLAYEEYCGREEAGEPLDPMAFCERFPSIRSTLQRQLEVHRLLQEHPQLLEEISETRWPEVPETFLGFSLVRELGAGAFARVFLATEPALGNRQVVVKVSLHGGAEAKTLGRLDHPNIVPILSVRDDPETGLTAICMPYVGSATLCDIFDHAHGGDNPPLLARTILEAVRLKSKEVEGDVAAGSAVKVDPLLLRGSFEEGVLLLGAQLAEGLAFIHGRGVCHRDLKPSNILVTEDGRAMLLDFNLSADERQADQRLGGTLPFMSPEQLQATGGSATSVPVDFRSDLFSLGVVLYQLLTGKHPFGPIPSSGDVRARLLERQKAPLPLLWRIRPETDGRFASLIEECLAFEPGKRPGTAIAVAVELRGLIGWQHRLRRQLARQWKLAAAMMLALVLLAVGVWKLLPPPEPPLTKLLRAAHADYSDGNLQSALDRYTQAVLVNPESAEAYFGRGRVLMKLHQFQAAISDFDRAIDASGDARAKACIAFCLASDGRHQPAIDFARSAIKSGYANAAVYNNLGYSQLRLHDLKAAKKSFDTALSLNDRLQAVYHNRARLDRERFFRQEHYVPVRGIGDLRKAMEIGPVTTELAFDAAYLCACAAKTDKSWVGPALQYLEQAITLGQSPVSIASDSVFAVLAPESRFQVLLKSVPPSRTPGTAPRLLDPVED